MLVNTKHSKILYHTFLPILNTREYTHIHVNHYQTLENTLTYMLTYSQTLETTLTFMLINTKHSRIHSHTFDHYKTLANTLTYMLKYYPNTREYTHIHVDVLPNTRGYTRINVDHYHTLENTLT